MEVTCEFYGGTYIEKACETACDIAARYRCEVSFTFNGAKVTVTQSDTPEAVQSRWGKTMDDNAAAYRASPEYAEQQRKAKIQEAKNIAKFDKLTARILRFKSKDFSFAQLKALSQWCFLQDYNYISGDRVREVVAHVASLGFVDICELPDDLRSRADTKDGTFEDRLECVMGNVINCVMSGPVGKAHPVCGSWLEKLAKEKQ